MKMLPEITRVDDKEISVQSVGGARAIQVLSRGNVFTKTWKLVIYIWKSCCHAVDNPSEKTISKSSKIKK